MLARIADLAPDAASDHSGSHLRFTDRGRLAEVRSRLREIGYDSEQLSDSEISAVARNEWYAPADLSREEARTLARQIVPGFRREHELAGPSETALMQTVEESLFASFVANPIGSAGSGGLAARCGDAVSRATRGLLGADAARALGRFVDRWLGGT